MSRQEQRTRTGRLSRELNGQPTLCARISLVAATGSHERRLTHGHGHNSFTPGFSPNGKKIVFVSDRTGTDQIFAMRADGTHVDRLTKNSSDDDVPSFSPSGDKILFASNRTGDEEI